MSATAATLHVTCRFATAAEDGGILCHCAKVAESTVREKVEEGGITTIGDIIEATGAGSGCRACHCRIQRVISGLPARCGGRFDQCHQCGCIAVLCQCEAA